MSFPWQSKVMLENPWLMVLFFISLAILGSTITWYRQWKSNRSDNE